MPTQITQHNTQDREEAEKCIPWTIGTEINENENLLPNTPKMTPKRTTKLTQDPDKSKIKTALPPLGQSTPKLHL